MFCGIRDQSLWRMVRVSTTLNLMEDEMTVTIEFTWDEMRSIDTARIESMLDGQTNTDFCKDAILRRVEMVQDRVSEMESDD